MRRFCFYKIKNGFRRPLCSCSQRCPEPVRLEQQVKPFLRAAHEHVRMAYQRGAHALAIHYGYGKLRNIEHLYVVESVAYAGRFAAQGAHYLLLAVGRIRPRKCHYLRAQPCALRPHGAVCVCGKHIYPRQLAQLAYPLRRAGDKLPIQRYCAVVIQHNMLYLYRFSAGNLYFYHCGLPYVRPCILSKSGRPHGRPLLTLFAWLMFVMCFL